MMATMLKKPGKRKRSNEITETTSLFPSSTVPDATGTETSSPLLHIPTTYLIGAGPLLQDRFRDTRFDKFTSEHLADFDTSLSDNHVSHLLASLGVAVCDVTSLELVTKLADITQTMPDGSVMPCLDDPTFVYALARQTIERHKGSLYAMVYDTLSPISPRSLLDIETMFMAQRLEEIPQKEVAKIMAYFVSMNYAVRIDDLALRSESPQDDPMLALALTPHYYTFGPHLQIEPDSTEASAVLADPRIAHMARLVVYELRGFRDYSHTLSRSCSGSASPSGLLPRHLLWSELNDDYLEELISMAAVAVRAIRWACSHLTQDQLRLKSFSGMELHKILNIPPVSMLDYATSVSVAHALFDIPEDWHLALSGDLEERFAKLSRNDDVNDSHVEEADAIVDSDDDIDKPNIAHQEDERWNVFALHARTDVLGTPTNRTNRLHKMKRERNLHHHQVRREFQDDPIEVDPEVSLKPAAFQQIDTESLQ